MKHEKHEGARRPRKDIDRKALRDLVIEGCREMAEESLAIAREFEQADYELWLAAERGEFDREWELLDEEIRKRLARARDQT